MLEGLVGAAISAFVREVISQLFGWIQEQKREEELVMKGRGEVRTELDKERADALRRAATAKVLSPDTDDFIDNLESGKQRL